MSTPVIVLILKALEGRGAERMVTTLASAYVEQGYSVHVLCLEDTQAMALDSRVKYHLVPYYQTFLTSKFDKNSTQANAYKQVAKRLDQYIVANIGVPDLILANIYKINWIMSYSRLPNIVNVLHTALSKQFESELSTNHVKTIEHLQAVYGAHPCSCVSAGVHQDLLTLIGEITKTTTIYNPCDLHNIKIAAEQTFDFDLYGLNKKGYIIHVGSFDTMKNHRDLLNAYALTECRYPLVLVGTGRLEVEIKQLATELNIDNCVKFLGFQSNPYPLIAQAKLLVLSSKFEGFGYVIAEAQALEVPVVSTDCPFGPRELLPAISLVAVNDVAKLATLIDQAITTLITYKVPFNEQLLPECIARQYLDFGEVDCS